MTSRYIIFAVLLAFGFSCTPRSYLLSGGGYSSDLYAPVAPSTPVVEEEEEEEVVNKPTPTIDYSQDVALTSYNPFDEVGSDKLILNLNGLVSGFEYPIYGEYSARYGIVGGKRHSGLDISAPADSPIYSAFAGTVRLSRNCTDYGNTIVITHDNGLETVYAQNAINLVSVGDEVEAGEKIARCGMTGNATSTHLHFEVRVNGQTIDPELLLDIEAESLQRGILTITQNSQGEVSASLQKEEVEDLTNSDNGDSSSSSRGIMIGGKLYENNTPVAQEPAKEYHTVVSGDTLSQIAEKYHTSLSTLYKLNGMNRNSIIKVGQKIRIK